MSSRYRAYGRSETPWTPDGDAGWVGINMLDDPATLPPGYLSKGENTRLRDGNISQRPGVTKPGDFNPAFDNKIIGSHIFKNPNGEEVMLVATATANYVWVLQSGKDPLQIQIDVTDPSGTVGSTLVHFVQAFEKVLLLRLPAGGLPPLSWDGQTSHKFLPVTTPPPAPLTIIPTTWAGVPFQNRLLLYSPYNASLPWRDQFIATNTLDYDRYDATNFTFRVNAGESDLITCVFPYFKNSVVVFMLNSIHLVSDFTFDPALTEQRLLNGRLGSSGIYGPLMVGSDVIFLSQGGNGFYRLSEIMQDSIGTEPRPVSRKIQPIIDRINWGAASLYHSSAAIAEYAYFTLPLDHNNGAATVMVVYNTATGEWESGPDFWEDPNFRVNRLHTTLFDGTPALFALDYAGRQIVMMNVGLEDELAGDSIPVHLLAETRGLTCGDPAGFKRFERVQVGIRSYSPELRLTAISDGVNEEKELAFITKDRLKFYPHGHADFDPIAGDPSEPKRQDYSDTNDVGAIEDFEDLPDGPLGFLPPTPVIFTGTKQQSLERRQIRQNGRWCKIRIENTRGQVDVLGVEVESIPIQEGIRTLA